MEYEALQFTKKEFVATIILNRPETLNALNLTMCNEVLDALKRCGWDKEVRAIILTGAGKAFCAGGDIGDIGDFLRDRSQDDPGKIIEEIVSVFHPMILAIRQLKKPVIGAINGFCSGGGAGLAQACDILIAAENAKIHMAYAQIGQVVDGGNSLFLTQKLGFHRAAELIFTGGSLDAHEAYRLGIFNRVVSPEELLSEAEKLARKLTHASGTAINLAKSLLNNSLYGNLETQLEEEKKAVIRCAGTEEFKEGIKAFFEKRNPDFANLSLK
jgi:2-(1,2-epoxy-1,2-dihydrophenyl)acetyl-CoA isomerase